MSFDWTTLQEMALMEIDAILAALPAPLHDQARKLPVLLARTPSDELLADGIEKDTLGLFCGAEYADAGSDVMPPQIILFLENLWEYSNGEEALYREEIRTTYLHELGHYLGLDEQDLWERGID